ncbi:MAG: hypothetical protein ACE5E5_12055 [Phycisphaerae bacterium]
MVVFLAAFSLLGWACSVVETNPGTDTANGASARPGAANEVDATLANTGATLFSTAHATIGGAMLACANCHGTDGSGDFGPDIRGEPGNHLQEHAQGEGRHPDGVKFSSLTQDDFTAIAAFLGGPALGAGHDDDDHEGDDEGEHDDEGSVDSSLVGNPATGRAVFSTEHQTAGGAALACANCHQADGSGNIGPDIRGESGNHLQEHAQGSGRHPDGVKFTDLTPQDFADIAAFLAS